MHSDYGSKWTAILILIASIVPSYMRIILLFYPISLTLPILAKESHFFRVTVTQCSQQSRLHESLGVMTTALNCTVFVWESPKNALSRVQRVLVDSETWTLVHFVFMRSNMFSHISLTVKRTHCLRWFYLFGQHVSCWIQRWTQP